VLNIVRKKIPPPQKKQKKIVQEEQKKEEREAARNRFSSPIHHNLVEKLRAGVPVRRNSTNGGEAGGGLPVRRSSINEMAGELDLEAGSGQMMTAGGRKCSLGGKSRKRNVPGSLLTLQKNRFKLSNSHLFLFIFI
jgi:hypothetical protein